VRDVERALAFVLAREGGHVNHSDDPGGETNLGISRRSYPNEDIRGMTRERAEFLYTRDYWLPNRCDKLPYAVALPLFDFAVNAPAKAARKALQRCVSAHPDGVIGPKTLARVRASVRATSAVAVGMALTDKRLERYIRRVRSGRSSPKFLLGWMRRLHHVITEIHS
jgi:lysozyme family protein